MATPTEKPEITQPQGSGRKISHYATPVESEELEFIHAIEQFKSENNQPFPSWSEVLQIVKKLGYTK